MNMLHTKTVSFLSAIILFAGFQSLAKADGNENAIEIFEAMDLGQVEVKFIPRDEKFANVLIENNTNQVLHIELPRAVAAVPVLAQFGQVGGGQVGGGGGGNQSVGGGFGAGQNGFGAGGGNGFGAGGNGFGVGGGGGFMRIAPQKTRKLKATTVCLEYGKPNPNPKVAYRMVPIRTYTDDAQVAELCELLGQGEIKQKIAQAAAWHLANKLDWQEIAKINRIESKYLGTIPFFTINELKKAEVVVSKLSPKASAKSTSESYAHAGN